MKITSPDFEPQEYIPVKYTCQGSNINPTLKFVDVPTTAKSLTLIVDDPDSPSGTWVHWLLYNIDPKVIEITQNSIPQGAMRGLNDFGKSVWGGPCPGSRVHRYFFKLYALNSKLSVPLPANKAAVEAAMESKIIAQAELVGLYQRTY